MRNVRGTSGTNRFADDGARGFATSTQNTDAANELFSGPKSRMVPVHDSMGGYDGAPAPSEAAPVSDDDDLDPQNTRARFS